MVASFVVFFLPACSLVYDFSGFRDDDGADVGRADDAAAGSDAGDDRDAFSELDGFVAVDASSGIDAFAEIDAAVTGTDAAMTGTDAAMMTGTDAAMMTGADAAMTDAATVRVDAAMTSMDASLPPTDAPVLPADAARDSGPRPDASIRSCTGLATPPTIINLGNIAGLPAVLGNTSFVVRAVGADLAFVSQAGTGAVRLNAWSVNGTARTATQTITNASVGTVGAPASLSVGRDGTDWVVWAAYGTTTVRCADFGSGCGAETRPAGAASPYVFAQGPSSFVWVHASAADVAWRATPTGGSSFVLSPDTGSHVVMPDAIGTSDTGYVALLEEYGTGTENVAFAWFDTATTSASLSASAVGRTINSIYVTYDAATETALGVAATLPGTSHLLTARRGMPATTALMWSATSPRPIVSRGDGTFVLRDGTGYGLRSVTSPATVVTPMGEPGGIGSAVVVDGRYAYFAVIDSSVDRMELHLYDCL